MKRRPFSRKQAPGLSSQGEKAIDGRVRSPEVHAHAFRAPADQPEASEALRSLFEHPLPEPVAVLPLDVLEDLVAEFGVFGRGGQEFIAEAVE